MNGAFVHLALNHIPVIAVPIGAGLYLAGWARKSNDLMLAALLLWILTALIAVPVLKSGGLAAHVIKDIPAIVRGTIREHAEAADDCFWGMIGLAVVSLIGAVLLKKKGSIPVLLTLLLVAGSIFMTCWFSWVAHLGGIIRHPEIAEGFVLPASPATKTAPSH